MRFKNVKKVYLECLSIKEAFTYWRYWLLNIEFVVHIDYKPLSSLSDRRRVGTHDVLFVAI